MRAACAPLAVAGAAVAACVACRLSASRVLPLRISTVRLPGCSRSCMGERGVRGER